MPIAATLAIVAALVTASAGALAADRKPASVLPGVNSDFRIVKPAPAAEPDDDTSGGSGRTMRIGDWDVTISGSITLDVGAGNLPTPRDHGGPGKAR